MFVKLKQYRPKLGDTVVLKWKKEGDRAWGITGGFVLGVVGGESLGEHLVLDGSTYEGSFKSNILSLGILDLQVIPMSYVKKIEKVDMRRRPPWSSEKFIMKMEACYESNIDFGATYSKAKNRTDCRVIPITDNKTNTAYGMTIKEISAVEEVTLNISHKGFLQIQCNNNQLGKTLKWVREAVELIPGHKRLVLFSTKHTYRIWSNYREGARPTEELIERLAKAEDTSIAFEDTSMAVFPIGWAHYFFVELPENSLRKLFPRLKPLEKFVIKEEKRR